MENYPEDNFKPKHKSNEELRKEIEETDDLDKKRFLQQLIDGW